MNLEKPFFIFLIFYFSLIFIEAYYCYKKNMPIYNLKDSLLNILLGILGISNKVIFGGIWLAIWIYIHQFSIIKIENTLSNWIILFFANEFVFYWFHRLSHEKRILWAVHVNHHSSQYFNFTTAGRLPFFNFVVQCVMWSPLIWIGFDPYMVFSIAQISFVFGVLQHSQLLGKFPALEYIFNTPNHHKIHHASNPVYINHNYGNVLILFDRLFGTFIEEDASVDVKFGITKNVNSYNPIKVIFHEWNDIFKDIGRKTRDKLRIKKHGLRR